MTELPIAILIQVRLPFYFNKPDFYSLLLWIFISCKITVNNFYNGQPALIAWLIFFNAFQLNVFIDRELLCF